MQQKTPDHRTQAWVIEDAVEQAPGLRLLLAQAQQSNDCLDVIRPLLPPGLREHVRAGSLAEGQWCLLVPHHAAVAKLRQLRPLLVDALQDAGQPVERMRLKISAHGQF